MVYIYIYRVRGRERLFYLSYFVATKFLQFIGYFLFFLSSPVWPGHCLDHCQCGVTGVFGPIGEHEQVRLKIKQFLLSENYFRPGSLEESSPREQLRGIALRRNICGGCAFGIRMEVSQILFPPSPQLIPLGFPVCPSTHFPNRF